MSTKSTILLLPCCHIYRDVMIESFAIDVSYGEVEDNSDWIEVDGSSEFANLMRYLLKGKTEDELLKASKGEIK